VDNSFAAGIGKRLDGWPNLDLDPGAIIALSPALDVTMKAVYKSWGKGKYDARFNLDGQNGPTVIPPAYGLAGVNSITYTGDGQDIAYWNRYVAVTQMGGHGSFDEPRTGVHVVNGQDDLVSARLPALQAYQLSLTTPTPPAGTVDAAAAARGLLVFNGAGRCVTCHAGAQKTDANTRLHFPAEVVSEPEPNGAPSYASRSATKQYRTTPLRGLSQHPPYFHNGSAPTLEAVVARYNSRDGLGLTPQEIADLVQYLKTL
jgi:mono/diheme cytochrome c family protein